MPKKGNATDLMAQFIERIDTDIRNDKTAAPKSNAGNFAPSHMSADSKKRRCLS